MSNIYSTHRQAADRLYLELLAADPSLTEPPPEPPPHGYPPIPCAPTAPMPQRLLGPTACATHLSATRMIVIGWSGVGLDRVRASIAAGRLPNLAALTPHRGLVAMSVAPCFSAETRWTTIATGRWPHEHGVLGAFAVRDEDAGLRTVCAGDWKFEPFWNSVNAAGKRVAVVNWPATHLAHAAPGLTLVSPVFCRALVADPNRWWLPPGCVSPTELRDEFRPHRLHPMQLTAADASFFIDDPQTVNQVNDPKMASVLIAAAAAVTAQQSAVHLLLRHEPDVLAVSFDSVSEVAGARVGDQPRYERTVDALLDVFDRWLGVIRSISPHAAVAVVGDGTVDEPGFAILHGFGGLDPVSQSIDLRGVFLQQIGVPSTAIAVMPDVEPLVDHLFDAGLGEEIDSKLIELAVCQRAAGGRQMSRSLYAAEKYADSGNAAWAAMQLQPARVNCALAIRGWRAAGDWPRVADAARLFDFASPAGQILARSAPARGPTAR